MSKIKNKKTKIFKLSLIRSIHYQREKKLLKSYGTDMYDKWYMNPYSYIKSIYMLETSALIVFFAQFTKISPNHISGVYISLGLLSGLFLASNNDTLIFLSLIMLFTKMSFDAADGLLARIQNKTSNLGDLLDNWGGFVGSYSFLCGFGFYLYHRENNFLFIILAILIVIVKAIDLKDYSYHLAMYKLFKSKKKNEIIKKLNMKNSNMFSKNTSNYLTKIKNFVQNFVNDRSRTIDTIILLIFIDNYYFDVNLLNYIYYYLFLKSVLIFIGGIYITYYKNYLFKK